MRLIFVDDEPLLLQNLQRSLRSMAGEWTMEFVSSGREALESMAITPFDVVVTDMRMPVMDGAQLLQEVRTHSGLLVVTKGQEVTYPLLIKLANFAQRHAIDDKLMALVPVGGAH